MQAAGRPALQASVECLVSFLYLRQSVHLPLKCLLLTSKVRSSLQAQEGSAHPGASARGAHHWSSRPSQSVLLKGLCCSLPKSRGLGISLSQCGTDVHFPLPCSPVLSLPTTRHKVRYTKSTECMQVPRQPTLILGQAMLRSSLAQQPQSLPPPVGTEERAEELAEREAVKKITPALAISSQRPANQPSHSVSYGCSSVKTWQGNALARLTEPGFSLFSATAFLDQNQPSPVPLEESFLPTRCLLRV